MFEPVLQRKKMSDQGFKTNILFVNIYSLYFFVGYPAANVPWLRQPNVLVSNEPSDINSRRQAMQERERYCKLYPDAQCDQDFYD